jgi:hypothetical protein
MYITESKSSDELVQKHLPTSKTTILTIVDDSEDSSSDESEAEAHRIKQQKYEENKKNANKFHSSMNTVLCFLFSLLILTLTLWIWILQDYYRKKG